MDPEESRKRSSSLPLRQQSQSHSVPQRPSSEVINLHIQKTAENKDKSRGHKLIQNTIKVANYECKSDYLDPQTGKNYKLGEWELIQMWDKRKIKGTKSLIKWFQQKSGILIMIRVILSESYLSTNSSDIFIELNSGNVNLSLDKQKKIQQFIDYILQIEKKKSSTDFFSALNLGHFNWLKAVLEASDKFLAMEQFSEKIKMKREQVYQRRKINPGYILFPAQACLSWSPHHYLTIVQEKPIHFPRPIIGTLQSVRGLLDNLNKKQRFARKTREDDEVDTYQQKKQEEEQATQLNMYQWKVDEEVSFVIFKENQLNDRLHEQKKYQSEKQQDNKRNSSFHNNNNNVLKHHEVSLANSLSRFSPQVISVYKRFFSKNFQIPRQTKIKVFICMNKISELEDNIIYLVSRIKTEYNGESLSKVLLKNQFKQFKNIFGCQLTTSKYNKIPIFPRLQYEGIRRYIRNQISKNHESTNLLLLKCIFLENQYLHSAIEQYFILNFKQLKVNPSFDVLSKLGSYLHFDDLSAEQRLLEMMQYFLIRNFGKKYEKNLSTNGTQYNHQKSLQQAAKSKYIHNTKKYDDPLYGQKKKIRQQKEWRDLNIYLNDKSVEAKQNNDDNFVQHQINLPEEEIKKLEQAKLNSLTRNPNWNEFPCLVIKSYDLYLPEFEPILSQKQRKLFFNNRLLPMLLKVGQGLEKSEDVIMKKVIIANTKLINFIEKMNELVTKYLQKKYHYLVEIIHKYKMETSKFANNKNSNINRNFIGFCKNCFEPLSSCQLEEYFKNLDDHSEDQNNYYSMVTSRYKKLAKYCEKCRVIE